MQYGFFFDQTRCIGCNACTVSCKDWNEVNPGPVRWRKQEAYESIDKKTLKPVFHNLTMSCNHCEHPACIPACAVDAIVKLDNGIVLIDRDKCQKLELCIDACPFSAPHIAGDKQEPNMKETWEIDHPMQKCTYCWERVLLDGKPPVCVSACPTRSLQYGDVDKLLKDNKGSVRLNKKQFPYAYKQDSTDDTMPSFIIKPKKPTEII